MAGRLHFLTTLAKLIRPGGARAVIAENLLLKQHMIIQADRGGAGRNISAEITILCFNITGVIPAGMALLQMSQAEKISLLSTTTDGKSIVEVCFSDQ